MSHPINHAKSSARKWGGVPEDYLAIHNWFDETKSHFASWQHRALRHHSLGIFECEKALGTTIRNSDGKQVPVRLVGEQHVKEDLGLIPTPADWLRALGDPGSVQPWMTRGMDRSVREESDVPSSPDGGENTKKLL